MSEALVLPFVTRPRPADARTRSVVVPFENVAAVEIVLTDGYSAARLHDYAAPLFPAEIVDDPEWVVRFHPRDGREDWVEQLFEVVAGWLKTMPLPCAKAVQNDGSYLIRTPVHELSLVPSVAR